MDCTVDELMVTALAGAITDDTVIYVGASVPLCLAAASLAKATHAPGATVFPIAGVEMRRPITLTLRMVEAAVCAGALGHELTEILNRTEGYGVLEPLAPAQIDGKGNANTIVIGAYERPTVRLPGLAGADAIGSMPATNILYTTRHTRRVLVDTVDLAMTAGMWARRSHGAAPGGPRRLITNLAVFDWDEGERWSPVSLHPGVRWEDMRALTGFPLADAPPGAVTPGPDRDTLALLRRRIDPFGLRRLEFLSAAERPAELRRIMAAERQWLATRRLPC